MHRIALANLPFPTSPEDSITQAEAAIAQAAAARADVLCFPECYVPGYRAPGKPVPPPDAAFLERAWTRIAATAARHSVAVILGTERIVDGKLLATALVITPDASPTVPPASSRPAFHPSFQDKVQLDPSEEATYAAGSGRQMFSVGGHRAESAQADVVVAQAAGKREPLTFGIAICHEGWRYPETVRWAAQRGAHIVFHPAFHEAEPGSYRATTFADPANTFHEKAALCRAAENTIYFATVNYASTGSPTTSAVVRPDGTVQAWHPYGVAGLLLAEIDASQATGLLARRCKT